MLQCRFCLIMFFLILFSLVIVSERPHAARADSEKEAKIKAMKVKKLIKYNEKTGRYHVETPNYKIECRVSAEFTYDLAMFMEDWRKNFYSFFDGRQKMKTKAPVICWEDYETFLSEEGVSPGVLGFFRPGDLTLHVFCNDKGKMFWDFENYELREVIKHEGSHQLFQYLVGGGQGANMPYWFNEGSATVFMCYNMTRPAMLNIEAFFLQAMHFPSVIRFVEAGTMPDVQSILDITTAQAYQSTPSGMAYGRSSVFVSFMLQSKRGQAFFNRMWKDVVHFKPLDKWFKSPGFDEVNELAREDIISKCAYYRSIIFHEHEAYEVKFHYLCALYQAMKSKKKVWAESTLNVLNNFTGQSFTSADDAWTWLKDNRDYLEYKLPKSVIKPVKGLDITGEYSEDFRRYLRMQGMRGTWAPNDLALKNQIKAELFTHIPKSQQKSFATLGDDEKKTVLAEAEIELEKALEERKILEELHNDTTSWFHGDPEGDFRAQQQGNFFSFLTWFEKNGGGHWSHLILNVMR